MKTVFNNSIICGDARFPIAARFDMCPIRQERINNLAPSVSNNRVVRYGVSLGLFRLSASLVHAFHVCRFQNKTMGTCTTRVYVKTCGVKENAEQLHGSSAFR